MRRKANRKVQSGIYEIRNSVNDKIYIGSSIDIEQRWYDHKRKLRNGNHHSAHLQFAWNKYGEDSFHFQFLEAVSIDKLLIYEQKWLDERESYKRENGYNTCIVAGNTLGKGHSEETKQKLRKYRTGKRMSEESKKKISIAHKGKNNYFYGKTHTEEAIEKMRETAKRKLSWADVRKIRKQYVSGEYSQQKLANVYGVSQGTIFKIVNNRTWKE